MTEAATAGAPRSQRRSSGDLGRRLVRHYLPLALATGVALVVLMNVSFFDANRYPPPGDIMAEGVRGAIPSGDPLPMGQIHSGEQTGTAPTDQGGDRVGAAPTDQGGHQAGASPTGGEQPSALEMQAGETERLMRRYSTSTGYVALGLVGITLLIGPASLVLGRRLPVSSYLRRDIGIFAAIASVVHVIFGFLVKHADGILSYFVAPDDRTRILTTSFGLANWAGLAAVVIAAALFAVSSDLALRKLKAKRWKRIQRLNYVLFALVIIHALLYGALWRKTSPYTVVLGVTVIAVLGAQAVGIRLWRQRNARTAATAPV